MTCGATSLSNVLQIGQRRSPYSVIVTFAFALPIVPGALGQAVELRLDVGRRPLRLLGSGRPPRCRS